MVELRDYQIECLNYFESNTKNTCFCLPTGTGKTVTMVSMIAKNVYKYKKVLVICPTRFIKSQIIETFHRLKVNHLLGKHVTVSVFRTAAIRAYRGQLVVFDECHRIACASNQSIIENAERVIGFTATPERLDGEPLTPLDDIFEPHPIGWYMSKGHLCNNLIEITAPHPPVRNILDYDQQWSIYNNRRHFSDILESYKKYAWHGAKSIVFGTTLDHCLRLQETYSTLDLRIECLSYKDSDREKDRKMAAFKASEIDMLINVYMVSEGADIPDCDLVIFCAFTNSVKDYYQRVGRVLRPKEKAMVIDHAGMIAHHLSVRYNPGWSAIFYEALDRAAKEKERNTHILMCPDCGTPLPNLTIKSCPNCGFELNPDVIISKSLSKIPEIVKKDLVIYEISPLDDFMARLKKSKSLSAKKRLIQGHYQNVRTEESDELLLNFMAKFCDPREILNLI